MGLREMLDTDVVDAIAGWLRDGGPGLSDVSVAPALLVTTPGVLGDGLL